VTELPATALIIDLRDFTPTYHAFDGRDEGPRFLAFVESFLATCIEACRASFPEDPGERLHFNSTGDGLLAVFEGAPGEPDGRHALRGWLAALRIVHDLPPLFAQLGLPVPQLGVGRFGIGVESGTVTRIGEPPVTARIGHCINRAARLEAMTKTFASTTLMIGEQTNDHVARALAGVDYAALVASAGDAALEPAAVERALGAMRAANDALGLLWAGALQLKGVERINAFRLSTVRAVQGLEHLIAAARFSVEK
jgi:class 3 adenylate cyclase